MDKNKVAKSCCSYLVLILVALALASGVLVCVVVQTLSKSRAALEDRAVLGAGGAPANIVSSPSSFIAAPTNDPLTTQHGNHPTVSEASLSASHLSSGLGTDSSSTAAAAAPATISSDQHGDEGEDLALSTTLALAPAPAPSAPTPTATCPDGPEVLVVPTDAFSSPFFPLHDPATAAVPLPLVSVPTPTEDPESNPSEDDHMVSPPDPFNSLENDAAAIRIQAWVRKLLRQQRRNDLLRERERVAELQAHLRQVEASAELQASEQEKRYEETLAELKAKHAEELEQAVATSEASLTAKHAEQLEQLRDIQEQEINCSLAVLRRSEEIIVLKDAAEEIIATKDADLLAKDADLVAKDADLVAKDSEIVAKDAEIVAKDVQIANGIATIAAKDLVISGQVATIAEQNKDLAAKDVVLQAADRMAGNIVREGAALRMRHADAAHEWRRAYEYYRVCGAPPGGPGDAGYASVSGLRCSGA